MKNYSRKISILFSVIALFAAVCIIIKDVQNVRFYDMDSQTAITECTDFENARMSFEKASYSPEGELQSRVITYSYLCGIQQAETFEIKTDGLQIINFNRNFGEAKIIFKNQEHDYIYSFDLIEGTNEYDVEKGIYDIYIIGKYFSGKITFNITTEQ